MAEWKDGERFASGPQGKKRDIYDTFHEKGPEFAGNHICATGTVLVYKLLKENVV